VDSSSITGMDGSPIDIYLSLRFFLSDLIMKSYWALLGRLLPVIKEFPICLVLSIGPLLSDALEISLSKLNGGSFCFFLFFTFILSLISALSAINDISNGISIPL
jgi:hypothetical protein